MSDTLTPLQRKAAFKAAVTLHELTMMDAAKQLGVSYNHLTLVLAGDRIASRALQERIAVFIGTPHECLFSPQRRGTVREP